MFTAPQVQDIVKDALYDLIESCAEDIPKADLLQRIQASVPLVLPQPDKQYPEIFSNTVMCNQISALATPKGYKVSTDKSAHGVNPKASMYSTSKPDLILHNPSRLRLVLFQSGFGLFCENLVYSIFHKLIKTLELTFQQVRDRIAHFL